MADIEWSIVKTDSEWTAVREEAEARPDLEAEELQDSDSVVLSVPR